MRIATISGLWIGLTLLGACGGERSEAVLGPGDDAHRLDEDGREHHPGRVGIVATDASGRDVTPGPRVVTGRLAVAEDGSIEVENADRDHDARLDALEYPGDQTRVEDPVPGPPPAPAPPPESSGPEQDGHYPP